MDGLTLAFLRRLRGRLRSEEGFTLIELMVAIGVILVALVAMAYTSTIGFSDIALARQRQSATGLANQTLEQIRALPFDVLKKGLGNADLAGLGDPAITTAGCGTPPVYCYGGEQIPHGTNPNVVPLVPHTQSIVVGPTTFTVRAYVTNYQNITTNNTFRLTTVVSWPNPGRKGVLTSVQSQTIAYSGTGCLSPATHPFAAPCQPFFYATGSGGEGRFYVTGTIDGVALAAADITTPNFSSTMQAEQISAVQGIAESSGASLTITGNPVTVTGSQRTTSASDNDPAQPGNDYNTASVTGSGSAIASGPGGNGVNTLTMTPSTGDPGTTTSTTSASLVNPVHLCPLIGISQNDQLPCGKSTEQQQSAASITLDLKKKFDLGTTVLASAAASPSVASAFSNKEFQANADGLVHTDATRAFGLVSLGGLPSGLDPAVVPAGWTGYLVTLTGYTDTVTAETGTSTVGPSVVASGTLKYWNGGGYTTLSIVPGAPLNLAVASVHISTTVGGKVLQIDLQGQPGVNCNVWSLGCPTTGGTTTSATVATCAPVPCPNTRTAATSQANSPFVGNIWYRVIYDGEIQASLTFHVDLGTLLAQNTYQPSPSGA
jgi:prepilin-type N-terminal cleavage/methylation domain-containing protein